jgi:hypothetical protein
MDRLRHAFRIDFEGIAKSLLVPVRIGLPSTVFPEAKHMLYRSIWDTGAECSLITPKVVQELGLAPVSKQWIQGYEKHDKPQLADQYLVDLILPNHVMIVEVPVACCDFGSSPEEDSNVLIGMDIIMMGDLTISNGGGRTKFSFCIPPHDNPLCLVEKSIRVNKPIHKRMNKARSR